MKKVFYLQSLLCFCFILFTSVAKAAVPVVTLDPVNAIKCTGLDTSFVVAATGTTPTPTYKWQVSTDGTTWSNLKDTLQYKGTSTDTLKIHTDVTLTGYFYRAIVTNTDGADTSASATLTVLFPNAGTITGPSEACKTTTVTLVDGVAGGTWSSTSTAIATVGSTGIVTAVSFGFDTIKYTVTNTCGTAVAKFVFRVDTVAVSKPITGPTATCVGRFINLSNINVLGTGTWSASNTTASVSSTGVVTGLANGFNVITYDFSNSCNMVSSSIGITVDTVLSAGVISGTTNICYGSWVHLTESVTGGIWISGTSSVAVVDGSGNVTGVDQGTATISYLKSNACGTSIATTTVTVFSNAKAITGKDSVGIGATRTLTDTTIDGKWFSSDTSIAIIDTNTGVATGKDTGITTITYVVTNLCGTSSVSITLHVGPVPNPGVIGGGTGFDSSVCVGAMMALSNPAPGGVGVWSSKNDSIATISATGVVTGVKSGIDTILYTFTNGFGTSVAMLPIFVNQPPVIYLTGPVIVSLGGNYFFKGTPYMDWNPPLAPSIGTWTTSNNKMGIIVSVGDSSNLHITNVASFVVLNAGRDTLTYKLSNVCGTSTKSWGVELKPEGGVGQITDLGQILKVYPNPTSGAITVNLESGVTEQVHVVITNVLGAKVKELTMYTNKEVEIALDQPAGMYLLSATTSNGRYETKIIVGQ